MRDCRLECVQAVIERQKRMPAEANDDRLFLDRQHRRSRFLWSRPSVHDRAARLPLAHRLLIDAVTSGERSQALFTMLYRSTDRLSRRGAPVKNLAHSASFDSCNKNAPSKCGTKQLGLWDVINLRPSGASTFRHAFALSAVGNQTEARLFLDQAISKKYMPTHELY